jgi:hypothetical protein
MVEGSMWGQGSRFTVFKQGGKFRVNLGQDRRFFEAIQRQGRVGARMIKGLGQVSKIDITQVKIIECGFREFFGIRADAGQTRQGKTGQGQIRILVKTVFIAMVILESHNVAFPIDSRIVGL